MANTAIGLRWSKADENFRKQIDTLMVEMRTRNKARAAKEAGIERTTFYTRYAQPGGMTKREERQIASLFERYGLKYDPTLGEGAGA